MSSFDWKAFKRGKIVVHCGTEEKSELFLKKCEERGIKWLSGDNATDCTNWKTYGKAACFECYKGKLAFNDYSYVESHNYKIVGYPFNKPAEYPKIHITTDGKTTTAVKVLNGKEVARGVAKYHPDDKFDLDEGVKLALERLSNPFKPYLENNSGGGKFNYGAIGTETVQEAPFGEKLYVGDVVEAYDIVNKRNSGYHFVISGHDYPNGAIMGVANLNFKNGMSDAHDYNFQIRKVESYKDLKNGESYGCVTAILEEKHNE